MYWPMSCPIQLKCQEQSSPYIYQCSRPSHRNGESSHWICSPKDGTTGFPCLCPPSQILQPWHEVMSWKVMWAYAYPPPALLPQTLQKVQWDQCELILIVPCWTQAVWFPLLRMLIESPLQIPNIP